MCYSSAPALPPKPMENWDDFLNYIVSHNNGSFDDPVGLFIELTRGCENSRCYFKCAEFGKKNVVNISPEECYAVLEIFDNRYLCTGLFGQGDVTDYPFHEMPFFTNRIQVNFHAGVSESLLESFVEKHVNILINVHSLEDARITNHLKYVSAAAIPVAKNIDWKLIFSTLKVPTVFRGLSDSRSDFYVSPKEFYNEMFMEFGLITCPVLLKPVQRAFRPVVEKVELKKDSIKMILRRCFRLLDSKRITLTFPRRRDGSYDLDIESEIAKVNKLMASDTKCKICFGGAWKYAYPEEIHMSGPQCYKKNWSKSDIPGMHCVV